MATNRALVSSIISVMALCTSSEDEALDTPGVNELLQEMDDLASQVKETIE